MREMNILSGEASENYATDGAKDGSGPADEAFVGVAAGFREECQFSPEFCECSLVDGIHIMLAKNAMECRRILLSL